jgi:SNF2 family DNA or RNA helicase
MEKHLESLVNQTESYSAKLATDLTTKEAVEKSQASIAEQLAEESKPAITSEDNEQNINDLMLEFKQEVIDNDPSRIIRSSTRLRPRRASTATPPLQPTVTSSAVTEISPNDLQLDNDKSGDFNGADESESDVEETIDADESALLAAAGGAKAIEEEVSALNEEADMDLEELRRRYYGSTEDSLEENEESAEPDSESDEEESGESSAEGEQEGQEDSDHEESGSAMEDDESRSNLGSPTAVSTAPAESFDEQQARVEAAASLANAAQPKGFTFSTQGVKSRLPFLFRGSLREYQHIGMDWLISMYENNLNGILADEMGLGKTIQTIALFAWLACEKQTWGQHLIVVPTSVIVNWEMELKRFLPGFKILSYHGSAKERKKKREGWANPNAFHVCITSYQLVVQDAAVFKRKKWHYLVCDEAQNIKSFKSQRWQTLLTFRTSHRLLLTGTPLSNSLMELWSLMHFLMPSVFQSQKEFQQWFGAPLQSMVEGKTALNAKLIGRLHGILRPFILRRLKSAVASQLPKKHEYTVKTRLSKRQRQLYEDFINAGETKATLAQGNFIGMMNVLMQLRRVCNHPDLFAGRPILSPFDQGLSLQLSLPAPIFTIVPHSPGRINTRSGFKGCLFKDELDLESFGLLIWRHMQQFYNSSADREELNALQLPFANFADLSLDFNHHSQPVIQLQLVAAFQSDQQMQLVRQNYESFLKLKLDYRAVRRKAMERMNSLRCAPPNRYHYGLITSQRLVNQLEITRNQFPLHPLTDWAAFPTASRGLIQSVEQRIVNYTGRLEHFTCISPKVRAPQPEPFIRKASTQLNSRFSAQNQALEALHTVLEGSTAPFRPILVRQQLYFPDKLLVQYDCGKLQRLAIMLRDFRAQGHRVLIFTQMTKMLDTLEVFLNIYGYRYLRLDGSTKVTERARLMEQFNQNEKIFAFILSTRSGGIGINLTGADTVIFYDNDWNPAMDLQAQDRAHRIGQTKEVSIYRLVTENTIEENILKKSNQKRQMNDIVIGEGNFNTKFLAKIDPRELLGITQIEENGTNISLSSENNNNNYTAEQVQELMSAVEDESDRAALKAFNAELTAEQDEFSALPASHAHQHKKHSKSTALSSSHTAQFEQLLTPIQRFALNYMEFVEPLISAEQIKKSEAALDKEEQKYAAKQNKAPPIPPNPSTSSNNKMDIDNNNQLSSAQDSKNWQAGNRTPIPIDNSHDNSINSNKNIPFYEDETDFDQFLSNPRYNDIKHKYTAVTLEQVPSIADIKVKLEVDTNLSNSNSNAIAEDEMPKLESVTASPNSIATNSTSNNLSTTMKLNNSPSSSDFISDEELFFDSSIVEYVPSELDRSSYDNLLKYYSSHIPDFNHPQQPHYNPHFQAALALEKQRDLFNTNRRYHDRIMKLVAAEYESQGYIFDLAQFYDNQPFSLHSFEEEFVYNDETVVDENDCGLFSTVEQLNRMTGKKFAGNVNLATQLINQDLSKQQQQKVYSMRRLAKRLHESYSSNQATRKNKLTSVSIERDIMGEPFVIRIPTEKVANYSKKRRTQDDNSFYSNQASDSQLNLGPILSNNNNNSIDLTNLYPNIDQTSRIQLESFQHRAIQLNKGKQGLFSALHAVNSRASHLQAIAAINQRYAATQNQNRLPLAEELYNKIPWTQEEDKILIHTVNEHGCNWQLIQLILNSTPKVEGRLRSTKEISSRYSVLQIRKADKAQGLKFTDEMLVQLIQQANPSSAAVNLPQNSSAEGGGEGSAAAAATEKKKEKSKGKAAAAAAAAETEKEGKKSKGSKKDKGKDKGSEKEEKEGKKSKGSDGSAAAAPPQPKKFINPVPSGFGAKNVYSLIDRCMKAIKNDQTQARNQLKLQLQMTQSANPVANSAENSSAASGQGPTIVATHSSHKICIFEAHQRYGLPQNAMGKTLMPHQIIQLRLRRQAAQQNKQQQLQQAQQQQQQATLQQGNMLQMNPQQLQQLQQTRGTSQISTNPPPNNSQAGLQRGSLPNNMPMSNFNVQNQAGSNNRPFGMNSTQPTGPNQGQSGAAGTLQGQNRPAASSNPANSLQQGNSAPRTAAFPQNSIGPFVPYGQNTAPATISPLPQPQSPHPLHFNQQNPGNSGGGAPISPKSARGKLKSGPPGSNQGQNHPQGSLAGQKRPPSAGATNLMAPGPVIPRANSPQTMPSPSAGLNFPQNFPLGPNTPNNGPNRLQQVNFTAQQGLSGARTGTNQGSLTPTAPFPANNYNFPQNAGAPQQQQSRNDWLKQVANNFPQVKLPLQEIWQRAGLSEQQRVELSVQLVNEHKKNFAQQIAAQQQSDIK